MHKTIIICLLVTLTACSNSINTKPLSQKLLNKKVYVVLDYVEYRDDIGKLLNYDKHVNRKRIQSLQTQIENLLLAKGYKDYEFIMSSSGLDFNPENDFHLFDNKIEQQSIINPPFQVNYKTNDVKLNEQLIKGFKYAQQSIPVKNIYDIENFPVIISESTKPNNQNNFGANSLILYARVISPNMSMGNTFLIAGITGALTLTATGGAAMYVSTPGGTPHTSIVLVDNTNGEVIWKDIRKINVTLATKKKLLIFYKTFPSRK